MNAFTGMKMVGAIFSDVASYMNKKPITVDIPPETTVVDLTEYGLGTASVTEADGKVTVLKLT